MLETFHDAAMASSTGIPSLFSLTVSEIIVNSQYDGRTRTNLASLLLATPGNGLDRADPIRLSSVNLDEACVRGMAIPLNLYDVFIKQLDCREADTTVINFDRCSVGSLIADDTSALSPSLPTPSSLSFTRNGAIVTTYDKAEITTWINLHTPKADEEAPASEALMLLDKLCRVMLRQNWIRNIDEDRAGKALSSHYWPQIRNILEVNHLIKTRSGVQVGGPRSEFIRILRARELLRDSPEEAQLKLVRSDIALLG